MRLTTYDMECIENARKKMDADISRHFTIADIALQVNMGSTKLKQAFKQQYGKGLYTYLKEARMTKAMELVTTSEKNLKEIARRTGFKHYNNFISAFSKYYGYSPGHARKKYGTI